MIENCFSERVEVLSVNLRIIFLCIWWDFDSGFTDNMYQPSEMAAMDAEIDKQKRTTPMTPSSPETDENPSHIPLK